MYTYIHASYIHIYIYICILCAHMRNGALSPHTLLQRLPPNTELMQWVASAASTVAQDTNHCNCKTPQQQTSATHHCNTLQHTTQAIWCTSCVKSVRKTLTFNTLLQHTAATHCCSTLPQHTIATHSCSTLLQHTTTHYNTLQHTTQAMGGFSCINARAGHWLLQRNTATHSATHTAPHTATHTAIHSAKNSLLQHNTATRVHNTLLQHTPATHCNTQLRQRGASATSVARTRHTLLQHTLATRSCNTLPNTTEARGCISSKCKALIRIAPSCNTLLQHATTLNSGNGMYQLRQQCAQDPHCPPLCHRLLRLSTNRSVFPCLSLCVNLLYWFLWLIFFDTSFW